MIKHFFSQDKVSVALVAGLGSMVLTALLLSVGLFIAHEPASAHLSWYGAVFFPLILMLRYFIKKKQLLVTKTLIIILFITFIAFIALLFSTDNLTLNT